MVVIRHNSLGSRIMNGESLMNWILDRALFPYMTLCYLVVHDMNNRRLSSSGSKEI